MVNDFYRIRWFDGIGADIARQNLRSDAIFVTYDWSPTTSTPRHISIICKSDDAAKNVANEIRKNGGKKITMVKITASKGKVFDSEIEI